MLFVHDFSFPAPWDDYYSDDERYPTFTIMTRREYDEFPGDHPEESTDKWINIILDVPELTPEIVRTTISQKLQVPFDEVELCHAWNTPEKEGESHEHAQSS